MNIVITDGARDASRQSPIINNLEVLRSTLGEAVRRAEQQQRGVLASFTQPIGLIDAVRIFTGAQLAELGECFFWEHPAEHSVLVGIGSATTIETHGTTSFIDAASIWRRWLHDAVITSGSVSTYCSGPVFFGGFAFDPLCRRTELWTGFPDGLLVLPQLLFSCSGNQCSLTINRVMQVDDDSERCVQEIHSRLMRLFGAIEECAQSSTTEDGIETLCPRDLRSALEWKGLVAEAVDDIHSGSYEKVVLARGVRVTSASGRTFDLGAVLNRLRESYPDAYIFAVQRGKRFFVGATPERLVQAQDGQIQTMALAGSAPRGASQQEDEQIGAALLHSEKDCAEHAVVVTMVQQALLTHCTHVSVSDTPQLLKLHNVQHLKTPIVGTLLPGCCILDVMTNLHPTPAVGGSPRSAALEAIRNREQLDRGWYAGPLGWIGTGGHGEFAVALRSGLLDGNAATLFAGCGIVADSDPQSEYAESCLKLQAMLYGLGGKN